MALCHVKPRKVATAGALLILVILITVTFVSPSGALLPKNNPPQFLKNSPSFKGQLVKATAALGRPNVEVLDKAFDEVVFSRALFASFTEERPGLITPNYSAIVPFDVNTSYGWALQVKTSKTVLQFKEILTLPEISKDWKVGEGTTLKEDGKIAETHVLLPVSDSMVAHTWSISPKDPKGKYKVEVYYEDVKIFESDFELR